MPLTTRRSAFKRPSDPLLIFVFFMAVAMTACFAWNYSGPFRWFAELQLSRTGRFSHQFTLVFTFVALAFPPAVAIKLGRLLVKGLLGKGGSEPAVDGYGFEPQRPAQTFAQPPAPRVQAHRAYGTQWAIFAVVLWVGGGLLWYNYRSVGPMVQTNIEDWESGHAPQSKWIDLHGKGLFAAALRFGEPGRRDDGDVYIPVVSEKRRPGEKVHVFLSLNQKDFVAKNWAVAVDYEGAVGWMGLPGPVRVEFERRKLAPADDYAVLDVGKSPAIRRRAGIVLVTGGCVVMLLQCVYSLMRSGRQAKAVSERQYA